MTSYIQAAMSHGGCIHIPFMITQYRLALYNTFKANLIPIFKAIFFLKMRDCYVCHRRLPAHELDDHLLSHVPADQEPSGQAVSPVLQLKVNSKFNLACEFHLRCLCSKPSDAKRHGTPYHAAKACESSSYCR